MGAVAAGNIDFCRETGGMPDFTVVAEVGPSPDGGGGKARAALLSLFD
jgi:hypothetical protein